MHGTRDHGGAEVVIFRPAAATGFTVRDRAELDVWAGTAMRVQIDQGDDDFYI